MSEKVNVEWLAEAILRATKEEGRRSVTDDFEWYGSAADLAKDIAVEYARLAAMGKGELGG